MTQNTAPKMHISRFTNVHGDLVWQVMNQGSPCCRETDEATAYQVYTNFGGKTTPPPVWDGDKGEFVA